MKSVEPRLPIKRIHRRSGPMAKTFLAVFVPLTLVFLAVHGYFYLHRKADLLDSIRKSEQYAVSILAASLEEHLHEVVGDLHRLVSIYHSSDYADNPGAASRERLVSLVRIFVEGREGYDQVGLLGADGAERLRVDATGERSGPDAVEETPTTAGRSCLTVSARLPFGSVFFLPIVPEARENGGAAQGHAFLRLATPVANGGGERAGVIMLDIRGSWLLEHLGRHRGAPGRGLLALLDRDGNWLFESDPPAASSDPSGLQPNFANPYPREWQEIVAHDSGSLRSPNGLFTYETIRPRGRGVEDGNTYWWKLLSRYPVDRSDGLLAGERRSFFIVAALLALLAAGIAAGVVLVVNHRQVHEEELQKLAVSDSLTGLLNRRAFLDRLLYEKNRFDRYGGSLVVIMADIDHFKEVNDRFGQDAGDYVLRRVAKILQGMMRITDVLCRWSGEEYVLLLAGNREMNGQSVAEKVRDIVEAEFFSFNGQDIPVTMSFGVAVYQRSMAVEHLIQLAEQSLYYAKKNGRNRVVVAEQTSESSKGES